MKLVKSLFASIVLTASVVSCANKSDIENLQNQIDELKTGKIASIEQQMQNIQASITSLQNADSQLSSLISSLQQEQSSLKSDLQNKEKALSDRVDALKKYIDDELGKSRDWVTATFATLDQYQTLLTEIAGIKQSISSLDAGIRSDLEKAISASETSMKGWVSEQLSGYYTIAQMDAKLKALADSDASVQESIAELAGAVASAKTELTLAYQNAIAQAIATNNGLIDKKIADDIAAATTALNETVAALSGRISEIESRLGIVEGTLEDILAMVQSIVAVPTYSDGSIELKDFEDTEIFFEVSPRSASITLSRQDASVFSLDAVCTQTKSSMFTNIPVKSVSDNGECLVLTVDAARMSHFDMSQPMNARLKIDDGRSSMTTSYFPLQGNYVTTPLSTVRDALADDQELVVLGDNVKVKVEVVSNLEMNNASNRTLYVQDSTAGISFFCSSAHEFAFGDVLIADLSNTTLKRYNGYFEIDQLPLSNIVKIGSREDIEAIEVNVADFLDNKYEGRYIAIRDAQVISEDLEKTWVVGNAGTSIGIECSNGESFVVFSNKNFLYGAEMVPQGSGIIKGISTRYNDAVELFFARRTDWSGLTGQRFTLENHQYRLQLGYDTKTTLVDYTTAWKSGDKVFLSDGNISTICEIPEDCDGSRYAVVSTKQPLTGKVHCIYPGESVRMDGNVFYVDVPEDQAADGTSLAVFSGCSEDGNIVMEARTSLVMVSMKSNIDCLSHISLTSKGCSFAGCLKIDGSGYSHTASVESGTPSVKLSANSTCAYCFTVLPGTISGLELGIFKSDGSFAVKVASGSKSLSPGIRYSWGSVDPSTLVYMADLGLSVKWATCNLGASKPEDYGGYYQWAGTQDVTDTSIYLDWDNCPYHTGTSASSGWTKYNYDSSYGTVDNKYVLDPEDDVAHVKLGGKWRMPTIEEWEELTNTRNCSWTWTNINGICGCKFQSRKTGFTDNWIFLPAAGSRYYDRLLNAGSYGFYWSSSLYADSPLLAYYLYFRSDGVDTPDYYRYRGQSVRPVSE